MGILFNRKNKKNIEETFQEKRNVVAAEYVIEQHFGVFADKILFGVTKRTGRTWVSSSRFDINFVTLPILHILLPTLRKEHSVLWKVPEVLPHWWQLPGEPFLLQFR